MNNPHPTHLYEEESRMRIRIVIVSCALALAAGVALAQNPPASDSSAAADTAKKPVSTKVLGKSSPAPVDAAVKSIDAQIAKNAADKKDPAWKTKLKAPAMAKFDPAKRLLRAHGRRTRARC
jgi:hypothetical protein